MMIATWLLKPVPEVLRGASCGTCQRSRAVWLKVPTLDTPPAEGEFVCSLCVVYAPGLSEFFDLKSRVEGKVGRRIEDVREADRCVSQIVLEDRLQYIQTHFEP